MEGAGIRRFGIRKKRGQCGHTGPELLSADPRKVNGSGAGHAGCLGSVGIEAVGGNDSHAGMLPFRCGGGRSVSVCHGGVPGGVSIALLLF